MARPEIYKRKADPHRADLREIKKWISRELQRLLPDDDIVVDYIVELIETDSPDIDYIDSQMAEFLGPKEGRRFCKALWERMTGMDTESTPENDTKLAANDEKKTNYNRSREEYKDDKSPKPRNGHSLKGYSLKSGATREENENQESRDSNRDRSPTRLTQSSHSERRLGTSRTSHGRNNLEHKLNFRRLHHW